MCAQLEQRLGAVPADVVGVALLGSSLSPAQWAELAQVEAVLKQDYETRRSMVLNRLDVTIESFAWSDRLKVSYFSTHTFSVWCQLQIRGCPFIIFAPGGGSRPYTLFLSP